MTRNEGAKYINKALKDAVWGEFPYKLEYKAANAGRELHKVDPKFTAQTCTCGAKLIKSSRTAQATCSDCGQVADRRIISSQVILQNAEKHSVQAPT
jgi:transposase